MEKSRLKTISIRVFALFLAVFSILFGLTWGESGYCWGDTVLTAMGLPAWSNGTQGTHYPAVISLAALLAAVIIFSMTTRGKEKTSRRIIWGLVVLLVVINLIVSLI